MSTRGSTSRASASKTSTKQKEVSDIAPQYFQLLHLDRKPKINDAETQRTFAMRVFYTKTLRPDAEREPQETVIEGFIRYNRKTYGVGY